MNNLTKLKQEIDSVYNQKISQMTKEEMSQRVNAYRKRMAIMETIFACILFLICFAGFIAIIVSDEEVPVVFPILIGILSILPPSAFLIDIWQTRKMPDEKLIKHAIQKEVHSIALRNTNHAQHELSLPNDFISSKTIPIFTVSLSSAKLLIDNKNKMFVYQRGRTFSKPYSFADIIDYEVYENGISQVQGRAGSALIGGAFFGIGGAIVGSSRSKTINGKCNQLKLIIRIKDFDSPQIVLTYINGMNYDKSSATYKKMIENIQYICTMFEYMTHEEVPTGVIASKPEENASDTKSTKDKLIELKEMLDLGLITEDDYEKKKQQILGL